MIFQQKPTSCSPPGQTPGSNSKWWSDSTLSERILKWKNCQSDRVLCSILEKFSRCFLVFLCKTLNLKPPVLFCIILTYLVYFFQVSKPNPATNKTYISLFTFAISLVSVSVRKRRRVEVLLLLTSTCSISTTCYCVSRAPDGLFVVNLSHFLSEPPSTYLI